MSLIDPTALRSLARRLDAHAAAIRERSGRLHTASLTMGWQSVAADAFRTRITDTTNGLRASAEAVEHAADVLRTHVRVVEAQQAVIRAAENGAEGALGEASHIAHVIGGVL
jgi:uncharacterized protein YukE